MLITREVDYAIRILRSLSKGELISMNELVKRELVPKQFAYKIAKKLENKGYIIIQRGVNGGCKLDCDLSQVSILDLLITIEEHVELNRCLDPEYVCTWRDEHGGCSVSCKLQEVQDKAKVLLLSYSIADLL